MREQMTIRRGALIATTVALVAAATALVAGAQTADGCDSTVGPIAESDRFTPNEARLSHLVDLPLATFGQAVDSSDKQMDGLELRWRISHDDGSSYEYFFQRAVDPDLTVPEFLAAGGIQLDRDAVVGGDTFTGADVIAQVGERAVEVQIGDYEGALVWADPESNGARPHHLYWSDGTHNNALIAVRGPQRMAQLARELVCTRTVSVTRRSASGGQNRRRESYRCRTGFGADRSVITSHHDTDGNKHARGQSHLGARRTSPRLIVTDVT